jgi:hypothetical protein
MAEPSRLALPELDVFRGFAAVLMIVNHAGYRLWDHADAFGPLARGVLVFSSSAPALFFFATGVGVGLRPTCNRHSLADTALKVVLLLLADQVFFWRRGLLGGVDFFSFIAGSMLIVTVLGLTRHPVWWALVAAMCVLALRFGMGPTLAEHLPKTGLIASVVGVHGQSGVSYPVSPWLVYPLAGLVVGIGYRTPAASVVGDPRGAAPSALGQLIRSPLGLAVTLASFGGCGSALLMLRGAVFFRWGSMSAAYFVLSIAFLGLGWALSILLVRRAPLASRGLSVRGVAAFLIVPIHYALIELLQFNGMVGLPSATFALLALLLIGSSIVLCRWGEMWILRMAGSSSPWVPAGVAVAAFMCLAVLLLLDEAGDEWTFLAAICLQVLVAYGLGRRLTPAMPLHPPMPPQGAA